jgi:cell division protein FtsZ
MQAGDGYGEEYAEDVDSIVDPLAGLRGASEGEGEEPLELGNDYTSYSEAEEPEQDDLLSSADRLAEEDRPVEAKLGGGRRRSFLGGGNEGGAAGGVAGGGSTLFERMANLSRSTTRDDEEDDDGDDSPALSIPRFLGRQNNQ